MKRELGRKVIVWVLCCTAACLPAPQGWAASPLAGSQAGSIPGPQRNPLRDVALQPGGILQGQVVNPQGQPCAEVAVQLRRADAPSEVLATARTDRAGRFQFQALSGGVFALGTAEGGAWCRFWAPQTAPPAAGSEVLIVHGAGTVRGNGCDEGCSAPCASPCGPSCAPSCAPRCGRCPIVLNPLEWALIGAGVAAAIAIPIAVSHRNEAS